MSSRRTWLLALATITVHGSVASAQQSPASAPAQYPAPQWPASAVPGYPAGPGVVSVHIDTNLPLVQLHRDGGAKGAVVWNGSGFVELSSLLCRAPCDQVVDGSRGESFRLKDGDHWMGPKFRLYDQSGVVRLRADVKNPGSRDLKAGGILTTALGGASVVFGLVNLLANAYTLTSDAPQLGGTGVGGAFIGAGAALIVAGVVMIVSSRRSYDIDVPHNASVRVSPRADTAARRGKGSGAVVEPSRDGLLLRF